MCRTGSVATIGEITENADMINKASVVPYSSHHLESGCNLSNMYRNHSLTEKGGGIKQIQQPAVAIQFSVCHLQSPNQNWLLGLSPHPPPPSL